VPLTVGALCLYAMAGGVALLRLSAAEASGSAKALRALASDRFVGAATGLDLAIAEADAAPEVRARDLETLLARAPLNPGAWLDLAAARRANGDDLSRVIAALKMSALAAPREAKLMAGRAGFALPFWSALPDDSRASLLADLAGVGPYLAPPARERLAALIAAQAPEDVDRICAALRARGAGSSFDCVAR
jgi:hypothetical protein